MKRFFQAIPLILFSMFILWGCASTPSRKKPDTYVFFPPQPDPPRIQFLTSITSEKDFATPKSSFADFIIGRKKKKDKEIKKPYGVAIKDGVIYVCDTFENRINILNIPGQKFQNIGGGRSIRFKKPINIAIDTDGTKYVTDPVLAAVVVLDRHNKVTGMYGKKELKKPTGVALFRDRLFVTDVTGNQVVVFDKKTGKILYRIGNQKDGPVKLEAPTNISVDLEGNLYVSETMGFRIQKLTQEGEPLMKLGAGIGDGYGQFARPKGVAVDREGRVYSVDAWHSVVQIFDPEGNLLLFFGELGNEPGNLNLPAQVIVDYDNVSLFKKYAAPDFEVEYLVIVTSQFGLKMVNIFGFGHKKGEGDV